MQLVVRQSFCDHREHIAVILQDVTDGSFVFKQTISCSAEYAHAFAAMNSLDGISWFCSARRKP